ncbi:glycoside hydrolase family 38 C-terminal domain-containing protein [Bacteroidota bacterium]
MKSKKLFLICNSHIDPVWLWELEEGLAETLSTFRTAAKFCEEYDEFVFCHNEQLLYNWVEEYEPALFKKIQELVKAGKWHIMGGWFLQPDCNIPSGESFVRQIIYGKNYFLDKFGVEPRTAINFDPFGHTRGLVQILKKSGYSSYLFCRPDNKWLQLPDNDFIWVGYDGSKIYTHRASEHYNSFMGKARNKIDEWLEKNEDKKSGMLLWGIGNHGGGPSRYDLDQIREVIKTQTEWEVIHGTPEQYFNFLESEENISNHEGDLNPWAVGCYTSMRLIKRGHRELENNYYLTEKMVAIAAIQGLIEYPAIELDKALEDLLFSEFHDILPGSAIQKVETFALQKIAHGMDILSRIKTRAFFALLEGEPAARDGEYPLYVFNPHSFPVNQQVEFEFQPPEPNFNPEVFWLPEISEPGGDIVPCQIEKESCNIFGDQRKRVVFNALLKPSQMNHFSVYIKEVDNKTYHKQQDKHKLIFKNQSLELSISRKTGLIEYYKVDGFNYLKENALQFLTITDNADPWGMRVNSFRDIKGYFRLMTKEESASFTGISENELAPVRIIEEGTVRTIVEALFIYNGSKISQRYKIPMEGTEVEIETRIYWDEKDTMLKLSLPTTMQDGSVYGQVAYGVEKFIREKEELVAQKWICLRSNDQNNALSFINDGTYGFDYFDGELRISLLRSPSYAGHPVEGETNIVRQDRFEPRIDQGERIFKFWINAGEGESRLKFIDREAQVKNEFPISLVCYPPGNGKKVLPGIILNDDVIQFTAFKMSKDMKSLILRLFNPTENTRNSQVEIPYLNHSFDVQLNKFELKTYSVNLKDNSTFEVDLLERELTN